MKIDRAPYKRDSRPGAELPEGKTCGDCVYFKRCHGLLQQRAGDEVCDWTPPRFVASQPGSEEP